MAGTFKEVASSSEGTPHGVGFRMAAKFGPGIVIMLVAVLYVLSVSPWFNGSDDAIYMILAKSLASGQGYANISFPHAPPESHWPIGLPLLLAPIWWLSPSLPQRLWLFQLIPLLASLIGSTLAYHYFRAVFLPGDPLARRLQAALIVLVAGLAPYAIIFSSKLVATEAVYTAASLAALLCLYRYASRPLLSPWLVATGLALVFAYLTRTIGLVLIASALGALLMRREFKKLLAMLVFVALLLSPWIYRNLQLGSNPLLGRYLQDRAVVAVDYADAAAVHIGRPEQLFQRAVSNSVEHFRGNLPLLLLPLASSPRVLQALQGAGLGSVGGLLGLALIFPISIGYVVSVRRDTALGIYIPLYLIGILSVSFATPRLLVPILPFLVYFLFAGLSAIFAALQRTHDIGVSASTLASGVLAVVLVGLLISGRSLLAEGIQYWVQGTGPLTRFSALMESSAWLKQNTPASSVIAAQQNYLVYLFSDRKTISLPAPDLVKEGQLPGENLQGEAYFLVQPGVPAGNDPQAVYQEDPRIAIQLDQHPDQFALVFASEQTPRVLVYSVRNRDLTVPHDAGN